MFNGSEWEKNQDFLDKLRPLATECHVTVSQLVLNWTIQQPGITVALCGAKRPDQIHDNARTLNWNLTAEQIARINQAIAERGEVISRAAV
jgi:aryl-alcohol dehydrogenase-like predicted oxidoreductase